MFLQVKESISSESSEGTKKAKTEKTKRMEALSSITTIASNTHDIYKEYQRANTTKETFKKEQLRIEKMKAEIQVVQVQINVASALGNMDELRNLSSRLIDLVKELNEQK
jgi:hypothetical protein